MKVFKNHYGDLRRKRSEINRNGLGNVYRRVLQEFNENREKGNYLVSFLLIQSLLEDRIYVLYRMMLIHQNLKTTGDIPELEKIFRSIDVGDSIKQLKKYGWIDDILRDKLFSTLDVRNKHIHFSFMGLDNFTEDLCNGFYKQFREVDGLIRKYKKLLKESKTD